MPRISAKIIWKIDDRRIIRVRVCVCVCVCVCVALHSSRLLGSPSRRLGYVSPAAQAIPKDLVIIHSRDSTWGDLFRPPPVPS